MQLQREGERFDVAENVLALNMKKNLEAQRNTKTINSSSCNRWRHNTANLEEEKKT